jgi:hypothetical protein
MEIRMTPIMVCQPMMFSLLTRRVTMKLFAATLFLAAVTVTGCATDDSTGGEYLAGLRPVKPALTTSSSSQTPDYSSNGVQERGIIDTSKLGGLRNGPMAISISDGDYPLPNNVCDGCEVTLVSVPRVTGIDNGSIGDIDVMDDGGNKLCSIHLAPDGGLDTTSCNR